MFVKSIVEKIVAAIKQNLLKNTNDINKCAEHFIAAYDS